jgi:hypothetical protein
VACAEMRNFARITTNVTKQQQKRQQQQQQQQKRKTGSSVSFIVTHVSVRFVTR